MVCRRNVINREKREKSSQINYRNFTQTLSYYDFQNFCLKFFAFAIWLTNKNGYVILQAQEAPVPRCSLILFKMGLFGDAHGWRGAKRPPFPNICHTYTAMMKLGTVIPYVKKI